MSRKAKLIVNIIATLVYVAAFVGFFLEFIYGWILGIGSVGRYYGWQLALNFEGMPQNFATLFPMLVVVGTIIYGIIAIIKKIAGLKKEPKESKGGALKPMLAFICFIIFPLISMFLCLATRNILDLPLPKNYGGYYMGFGPYLVGYSMLIGGLMMFITESGIFKDKPLEAKADSKPAAKVEAKPVQKPVVNAQAKPAAPQAKASPAPQTKPVAQAKPAVQAKPVAKEQPKAKANPLMDKNKNIKGAK